VLNALMEEQQRPQQVTSGLLQGLRSRLPALALAAISFLHGSDTAQMAGSCSAFEEVAHG
jgi:hypothetical protein